MNKIYAEQVLIGSRLGRNRTPELVQPDDEVGRTDREVSAKEALIKIPEMQFMTLEPRQNTSHRKEISFSKLSDWQDKQVHKQQSPVLTMQNTSKPSRPTGVPSSAKDEYRTDIRTIVEVAPHSSQTRRSHRYTNQAAARKSIEISTNILVSDDLSRQRMHKVTNSDLDNLIKEVMQSREDPFARIPAVNMSKNFNTIYQFRNKTVSTSSQGRRDQQHPTLKNSTTLDANPERNSIKVSGNFSCSFPLRRHKRSKSNRSNRTDQFTQSYLQTLDNLNLNDMRKVLLKYNNSGLYKERMRAPSACSTIQNPRRSIEKKQQEAVAKGSVGVVGCRITPLP